MLPRFLLSLAAATTLATTASAQYLEARNTAMGGTGVASSHYYTAPLANPSLLTRTDEGDTFGLLVPSLGVVFADEDGLVDAIDNFQSTIDQLQQDLDNATATPQQVNAAVAELLALDGKTATGDAGANFVFALPLEDMAIGLMVRTYLDARVFPQIDAGDPARITGATTSADLDNLQSEGRIIGTAITEVGISFAKRIDLEAATLSIGITPKFQRVDTYNYSVNVNNFDEDDFDGSQFRNDDTGFNIDLGASVELPAGVSFGLMIRDVLEEEYDTVVTNGQMFQYHLGPVVTVGASYSNEVVTLSADIDVTELERFDLGDESRFVRVGVEFDALDWAQLRAGAQFDTEDTVTDLLTFGVGFSPFDTFHLDVAGVWGEDDTYGVVVQTALTF